MQKISLKSNRNKCNHIIHNLRGGCRSWRAERMREEEDDGAKAKKNFASNLSTSEKWILISFYCHQALCFAIFKSSFVEAHKKHLEALSLVTQRRNKEKKSHPQIIIMLPCMRRIIYEMNEALCHIHPSIHEFLLSLCRVSLPFFLHAAHLFQSNHLSLPHRGRRRLRIAPKFPDLIKLSKARKISILP